MKKILIFVVTICILYIILSNFFIYLIPIKIENLYGNYESVYDDSKYILNISSNKKSIFTVKKNNKIIYKQKCNSLKLEKLYYRKIPEFNVSFFNCDNMNSNAILKRDIFFNITIGNNGYEGKRIDPDTNTFFQKKE